MYLLMRYSIYIVITIFTFLVLSACSDGTKKYVECDDVKFVEGFPKTTSLSSLDDFRCDEIGLLSVKAVDGLLILTQTKGWEILSPDTHKDLGTCVISGEGPDEVLSLPRSGASFYYHKDDSLITVFCDKDRGIVYSMNLTEFIQKKDRHLKPIIEYNAISNNTWEAIPMDSINVVCSAPNPGFTGFYRMIATPDSIYEPIATKQWSKTTVNFDKDINLLAKVTRVHPDGNRIVEAMLYLNQINIFTKDGNQSRTICVGSKLDNLAAVEDAFRFMRKDTYITVSTWDFGFGAVYAGRTEKEMQTGATTISEIHFFDWDGNPIVRVCMPISVRAFDIDTKSNVLYAIDDNEDILRAFDAVPIISAYKM